MTTTPSFTFTLGHLDEALKRRMLSEMDVETLRRVDYILDRAVPYREREGLGAPLVIYPNHRAYKEVKELLKWYTDHPITYEPPPKIHL